MEIPDAGEEAVPEAVWDWGSLLDFAIDDHPLILSWGSPEDPQMPSRPPPPAVDPAPLPPPPEEAAAAPPSPPRPAAGGSSRVRKRDPMLVCANYLAGRIPCACPEMDEKELEEEEAEADEEAVAVMRKRARAGGSTLRAVVRCQVPECEVDIRELKGYHRRHRVCLRCATASSVVIDGEHKRYCQQCGKFHILPDFDEGKRSCRRKLERHNKRRRRRPTDGRNIEEKETEPQGDWSADIICDGETRKEVSNGFACETVVSNKIMDRETLLESEDGHGSPPICSPPSFQNGQSNSVVPLAASVGDHIDERTDNAKSALSSTLCDNKSVYSSVCPTGRISFKLYDWNPAEFPRRLRHQIFQWLASMPVELEGYIRPGCTILTVFIAMPRFMWEKLYEDVALYVRDLVNAPESLFLGRGNFLIYLSNRIVQVLKDGTSLVNIKMEVKAPRLHYVYPTYFEAGKPIEFFACGSNLDQPKFRFLVSFAGKYLAYDSCHAISHGKIRSYNGNEGDSFNNSEHEMFRINITQTDSEVFGPAFIEVENESGLSNFVPVLFGNKHICSELERIQETFSKPLSTNSIMSQIAVSGASPGLCKLFVSKQDAMSELLLDIAWLLKEPQLDKNEVVLTSTNIRRSTSLLKFAIQNEFVSVLEVIQHYLGNMTGESVNMTSNDNLGLLLKYMSHAREILDRRTLHDVQSELNSRDSFRRLLMPQSYVKSEMICTVPWTNQDVESNSRDSLVSIKTSSSQVDDETIPLVTKQIIRRQNCYPYLGVRRPREGWSHIFPERATGTRLAVFVMVSVVMCFGACIVLLHPRKAREFAVSVRRCMFGDPLT